MTQAALGKAVGVSQAAIAQIETGAYLASDELAYEIAVKTDQPISFFQQEPAPEFDIGSLLFRSHAAMSKKLLNEAYRHAQLAYEVYLKLQRRARALTVKIEPSHHRSPAEAAAETRKRLGVDQHSPIPHLVNILEWHGVVTVAIPDAPFRDAFSLWKDNAPVLA
ncbi:MAG TPA: helix-turn-helix domain-containing protein, partial [Bryobacteraceae bacterium]|nr:helix-turn-helix domain-containing protein [Bryobacteraceae bacterium]